MSPDCCVSRIGQRAGLAGAEAGDIVFVAAERPRRSPWGGGQKRFRAKAEIGDQLTAI